MPFQQWLISVNMLIKNATTSIAVYNCFLGYMLSKLYPHLISCARLLQFCPTLCNPKTVACQTPLFMEFSRQEDWSELPCPPPGDLPDPWVKLTSPGRRTVFPTCPVTGWISPLFPLGSHPTATTIPCDVFPCDFSGSLMPLWLQFQLSFFQLILGQRGEETF